MANLRFGCQVDGVTISEQQVAFASDQAAQRGLVGPDAVAGPRVESGVQHVAEVERHPGRMYVDLFELFAEFSRLLEYGGRYV